jgi:hypothetical protein
VHIGRLPGFKSGLTRIFGEITRLAEDFSALQICSNRLVATPFGMEDEVDLPERCVKVVLDERTGVFGPDGLPVRVGSLMIGDLVTIVGFLGLEDEDGEGPTPKLLTLDDSRLLNNDNDHDSDSDLDSDSDSDSDGGDRPLPDLDFVLRAIVIEGGPMGTFARIRGQLKSAVEMDHYRFLVGPNQGFGPDTMLLGELYPTSRIFKFDGTEIRRQELMAGDGALVDGVLILNEPSEPVEGEPEPKEGDEVDTLRSAFMLVRLGGGTEPPEPEEETLVGKILSLDESNELMRVATSTGDRCVLADEALILFLIENDEGGLDVIKGSFIDLDKGLAIVAFGVEDIGGCFDADFIVTQGPMKPGIDPQ